MLYARKSDHPRRALPGRKMVMKYEITEINEGVVTVKFEDGSWANVGLDATFTPAEVDFAIMAFAPKNHTIPDFITVGYTRAAPPVEAIQILDIPDATMDWFQRRVDAYGSTAAQIEFITENGLEAWQAYVAKVKADNPKE
jgi:hypothetical protein